MLAATGQDRDPAVPELDQVSGQRVGAGLGVAADAVDVARGNAPIHHDHRNAVGLEQPEGRAGAAGRDEEDAVHLALDQHQEVLLLLLLGLVGVAVHDARSRARRRRPRRPRAIVVKNGLEMSETTSAIVFVRFERSWRARALGT